MSGSSEIRYIDPRNIHPFWYALAVVVAVVGIGLFYVMQTTGFSDQPNNVSIELSDPPDTVEEG